MKRNFLLFFTFIHCFLLCQEPVGLNNARNTCYQNAVLQCLYNIPELTQLMLNNKNTDFFIKEINGKKTIAAAYIDLLEQLNNAQTGSVVNPLAFCLRSWDILNFPKGEQADAQNFLAFFLNNLIDESINPKHKEIKFRASTS